MKFDERYEKKLPLYKKGRCEGPRTYTYKDDGFRIHYLGYGYLCNFCDGLTKWGVTYFYPDDRFKAWKRRDVSTYYICCEEEIPLFKAQIVENKINGIYDTNFVPRTSRVREELNKLRETKKKLVAFRKR